jgi:hypothetical protein
MLSKTIGGLVGPTFVAIAIAMLLNVGSMPLIAAQVARDPALILLSGILLLVAGIAIVRAHNVWSGGWPVLVTIVGWLALLGGLARIFFPHSARWDRGSSGQEPRFAHRRCGRPAPAWRLPLLKAYSRE